MTKRFLTQCIICHCSIDPGQGTRHRTGYAHIICLGGDPQRSKIMSYREPVTVRAELVHYAARDCALSWPYTDGSLDDSKRVRFFWLPRSQVTDNNNGTITIPRWLQGRTGIGSKLPALSEK